MCFVVEMPNLNPSLGPKLNGMQTISVYDSNLGNTRTIYTEAEKVDQYMADRRDAFKKGRRNANIITTLLTGGAAFGGWKINAAVKEITETAAEHLADTRNGAIFFGLLGLVIGLIARPDIVRSSVDKVNQKFIQENM